MEKIVVILKTLESLCLKYGCTGHAEIAAGALTMDNENAELFWKSFNTAEWWGGAGSMADLYLYDDEGRISEAEKKNDNRQYCQSMADLSDEMVRAGFPSERAAQVADVFKYWIKEGIK